MSSQAGAALLTKIALTLSNSSAGQITQFLTLAQGWDMREVGSDLPSTITASAERDNLNFRGAFARRVNTIPLPGDVWSSSGTYLWNIYGDLLAEGGAILADMPDSDNDEARVQAARAIMGPPDTPQYRAYVTYRDQCRALERSLRLAEVTVAHATDPIVQAQAQIDCDQYREQLDAAQQEWLVRGYKTEIEEAMQTLTEAFFNVGLRRWRFWRTEFGLVTSENDKYGAFWPTGYHPAQLCDTGVGWIKFTLSGSEVAALAASAPPEVLRTQEALGDAVHADGEIQELSMEIARVDVERPWFHPELFVSRFWKPRFPDEPPLSDGGQPFPQGTLPGYVIGLVLARNIVLTWKGAAGRGSGTTPICVLGNFALDRELFNQANEPLMVRPVPGEEIERAVAPVVNPPTVDTVTSVVDLQLIDTSKWAGSVASILRPEALHVAALSPAVSTMLSGRRAAKAASRVSVLSDETTGSQSTGDAVYLVAYIVQRTPKSPDPDPALAWP